DGGGALSAPSPARGRRHRGEEDLDEVVGVSEPTRKVVSLSEERARMVLWRDVDRAWQATLVCKVTHDLRPGVLQLAARQLDVCTEPLRHEDGSLWAPSDLAPY